MSDEFAGFARLPSDLTVRSLLSLPQLPDNALERIDDLVLRGTGLVEADFQVERLRRRLVGKHELPWTPRLRLRDRVPQPLARRPALAGNPLDQRGHFLGGILPNDL